jgi:Lon protease-like protein
MNLPQEMPVMTLPNAVLFPHALMPLHIFEPKYRKMLHDCIEGDRLFGIARVKRFDCPKHSPEPCDIATIGVIRASVDHPDGTSNLILQGLHRVRILEILQERPYRKVRIVGVETVTSDTLETTALLAKVAELAVHRASHIPQMPEGVKKFLRELSDPAALADIVAYTLVNDPCKKQHLLETTEVQQRLHDLIPLLSE